MGGFGWDGERDGGGCIVTYPSPWFWRLRMAAEAAVAVRRAVVVNFIFAPARGSLVVCWRGVLVAIWVVDGRLENDQVD